MQRINFDKHYWETQLLPKLTELYDNCLGPKIVSPIHVLGLPVCNLINIYIETNAMIHMHNYIMTCIDLHMYLQFITAGVGSISILMVRKCIQSAFLHHFPM